MLELDFRHPGQCELSYVGLVPDLAGQGHGRWLMAHALALAWRKGVARVWVHTCTLDHPAALGRSEEHTSELQSLMRISYAVFCLKKKKKTYDRAISQRRWYRSNITKNIMNHTRTQ